MAAKAALAFLLLATAAAYSSQRVPIDAPRSHVVAAERRRRFNAAAALIGAASVAPSDGASNHLEGARPASLHTTSRGDGVEVDLIRNGAFLTISMCRRRDGATPTQDDREDVNAVFLDGHPKAILIESGIALVILALAKAGVGPLGEKYRENGD